MIIKYVTPLPLNPTYHSLVLTNKDQTTSSNPLKESGYSPSKGTNTYSSIREQGMDIEEALNSKLHEVQEEEDEMS